MYFFIAFCADVGVVVMDTAELMENFRQLIVTFTKTAITVSICYEIILIIGLPVTLFTLISLIIYKMACKVKADKEKNSDCASKYVLFIRKKD